MMDIKVSFLVVTVLFAFHYADAQITFSAPAGITGDAVTLTEAENLAVGGTVETFTASGATNIGYSLTGTTVFAIDASSGVLTLVSALDFESATKTYAFTVTATNTDDTTVKKDVAVTVNVVNSNEAPTITPFTEAILKPDQTGATALIATLAATDPDAGDTLTYSITAGNTGNVFAIDGAKLQIATGKKLDAKTRNYYKLTLSVADAAGLTDSTDVVVAVYKCPSSAMSISANILTMILMVLGVYLVRKTV